MHGKIGPVSVIIVAVLWTATSVSASVTSKPLAGSKASATASAGSASSPFLAESDPANTLHLTIAQQNKLAARKKRFQADATKVYYDKSLTALQRSDKIADLQRTAADDIRAILTVPQRNIIDKQTAKISQAEKDADAKILKERAAESTARTEYLAVTKTLMDSMTNDQKQHYVEIQSDAQNEAAIVEHNSTLTLAQKKLQYSAIIIQRDAKCQAIFTPAQRALVNRMIRIAQRAQATPGSVSNSQ